MKPTMRSLLWMVPIAAVALASCEVSAGRPRPEFLLQRLQIDEIVKSVAPVEVRPPGRGATQIMGNDRTPAKDVDHGTYQTRLFLANPQETNYGPRLCAAVADAMEKAGAKVERGSDDGVCMLSYRNGDRRGYFEAIVAPDSGASRQVFMVATEV